MSTNNSNNPWHQEYLGKLQKILDLAMYTAEAASTEGNQKIVLQAAREVTRIITLMTKLNHATEPANDSQPLTSLSAIETVVSRQSNLPPRRPRPQTALGHTINPIKS